MYCVYVAIGHLSLARIANSKYVFGGLTEARAKNIDRREEGRWKECLESAARMRSSSFQLPLLIGSESYHPWRVVSYNKRKAEFRSDLSL